MNKLFAALLFSLVSLLFSCSASRNFSPTKKYPAGQLRADYTLLRNILEKKHPSLYWYTGKDSMDIYFNKYYDAIKDSMTELQFSWHILAPLVDKIHCGHTAVRSSKAYSKWARNRRFPSFPLQMKVWNDTMAVTGNLNRKDSIFKRGTIVTAVNGVSTTGLIHKFFNYLPEDGHANNINYIRMSGNFPYYHRNIYGLSKKYEINYIDSSGNKKKTFLPLFIPMDSTVKDSAARVDSTVQIKRPKLPHVKKILQYRSLVYDSTGKIAIMTVNTFSKGRLRNFFRRSFKALKNKGVDNLIIDLRSNGGGDVASSTLFTKYISKKPFRVADSLYAVAKTLAPYTRHIKGRFLNTLEMFIISKKKSDGLYHVRHLENKVFKPKTKNHYNGSVYVLTNGPTFSASALFCNAIKGQPEILLAGEETGGGWHGNSGIMIPDIKLPQTGVRVRLPLFRLVQYNHVPKTGTGIIPDLYIGTSYDALLKGFDKKMAVVKQMIYSKKNKE